MVAATKLTYRDYANTPDDERYELIGGELIMVPAPNIAHQKTSAKLFRRLQAFVEDNGLGWAFHAPTDVVLSDTEVAQPDMLFISNERESITTPLNIRGAPDFVVEILSPSSARYDWREKLELYSRHGVKEYWIVDPYNWLVYVMALRNGALYLEGAYTEGDTVASSTIEGFSVSVDDIF